MDFFSNIPLYRASTSDLDQPHNKLKFYSTKKRYSDKIQRLQSIEENSLASINEMEENEVSKYLSTGAGADDEQDDYAFLITDNNEDAFCQVCEDFIMPTDIVDTSCMTFVSDEVLADTLLRSANKKRSSWRSSSRIGSKSFISS